MSFRNSLPFRNCVGRPGRTLALTALSLFLCFFVLAGSLVISGLQSGLASLEARLGADIMVVPYEAATKSALDDIILQGNTGYFYMNDSILDTLEAKVEGIGEMTAQFYLATTSSSCCSYDIEIVGFDPETDFVITPWVKVSNNNELEYMEVFVGHDLNAFAGDTLQFYGSTVTVAGRLDETGTYMDTAVFASEETIKTLITYALESQIYDFGDVDPDNVVSSVLINVAEGYSVDEVVNNINLYVKGVKAVRVSSMIADVATKLSGVSDMIGVLIVIVWVLVLAIMILAFAMISNERKKEFAVLRVVGASRGKLASVILKETLLLSITGSVIGAALAVWLTVLFGNFIEDALSLPFLMPTAARLALLIPGAIVVSIAAGSLSSAICALRISRVDAALILRGDN